MGGEGRGEGGGGFLQPGMPIVQFRYKFKTFISTFNLEACAREEEGGGQ